MEMELCRMAQQDSLKKREPSGVGRRYKILLIYFFKVTDSLVAVSTHAQWHNVAVHLVLSPSFTLGFYVEGISV